mgnify:CR=1 FL=1
MTTSVLEPCQWCGMSGHTGICPTIKAIEYFEDGQIKRVEFKVPADYMTPILPSPPLPIWPQNPPWWGSVTYGPSTVTTTGGTDCG